jgi:hypothetical protein
MEIELTLQVRHTQNFGFGFPVDQNTRNRYSDRLLQAWSEGAFYFDDQIEGIAHVRWFSLVLEQV